jgi:hypothetical protein|tara:strand:+ start:209 stop:487 length:279 start_codon:yes stop_codon:yes gene_type:complete
MIKGSMMYDQHGRKRKVKKLYASKKATPNFAKQETKTFKSTKDIPSMPIGEYKTPTDNSYKQEVSKQYTVSVAYNKGAYQVIPRQEVKDIGK